MLHFESDYIQTCHPKILKKLQDLGDEKLTGYGNDTVTGSARNRIRTACGLPDAHVYFISGGTQTNALVIRSSLRQYQYVIAADTGHIACHEAGAIEAGGHKVVSVPNHEGKVASEDIRKLVETFYADENHDHMPEPGMIYISHPSEYGTVYTKDELKSLRELCDRFGMKLFLDGARLAYALASDHTDLTLKDIASLCDVFYIGGTKCGTMFGEAVVFTKEEPDHFFTLIKQNGALLAKGWIAGAQFDAFFTDELYMECGRNAISSAKVLTELLRSKGYRLLKEPQTNQIFVILSGAQYDALKDKVCLGYWEKYSDDETVYRFATSWGTTPEEISSLGKIL